MLPDICQARDNPIYSLMHFYRNINTSHAMHMTGQAYASHDQSKRYFARHVPGMARAEHGYMN